MMIAENLRVAVCDMAKRASKEGLFEGACGNLSLYDRESKMVVITPSLLPYDQYTPEEMVVIDVEGNIIEGKHRPSSEWYMHTHMYKVRENVNAVFHTHSPYASAYAIMHRPIPVILTEMIPLVGGDIRCAKMAVPGTPQMGSNADAVLDDRGGCLLANHGVLTVGCNLETAYVRAECIENAAKVCLLADSAYGAVPLSEEEEAAVREHFKGLFVQ